LKESILVVDDEPHIRRILQFLLDQHGYKVLSAGQGQEAISLARSYAPDLILLDIMMPHMDGFEVCRHLRADYRTSQIPIIMVTAKGEMTDRVRGLEGGANDYLTKPYDNKELLARVRATLDWSRSQRQANPLTGLPGNRAIEAELQTRIEQNRPFAFLYLDIDNFKAYNDHYGYTRGDESIQFVAKIIRECVATYGDASAFIGHIGGDDFCALTGLEVGETIAEAIVDRFDADRHCLLEPEDLARGYLEVRGRQGSRARVPFPSLTVALVTHKGGGFQHWARVSDVAAELKAYGKSHEGSIVVKERRSSLDQATPEGSLTAPDSET
jgi:PleD family two-component response regulator